jgi:hypothetical protein
MREPRYDVVVVFMDGTSQPVKGAYDVYRDDNYLTVEEVSGQTITYAPSLVAMWTVKPLGGVQ